MTSQPDSPAGSLYLFFDDDHILVAPLVMSMAAGGFGHMADQYWIFDRPVADGVLVEAVRAGWAVDSRTTLPREEFDATWQPVRDLFGQADSHRTNFILVNRIYRVGGKFTMDRIAIAATAWVSGNRESVSKEGRTRLKPDASDDDIARAIRAAMAATTGP